MYTLAYSLRPAICFQAAFDNPIWQISLRDSMYSSPGHLTSSIYCVSGQNQSTTVKFRRSREYAAIHATANIDWCVIINPPA